MALLRGPFGTGYVKRLGGTVGYKAGKGRYGIYAYQPDVINPRTEPQRIQRAKFSFLTKVAAMIGDAALRGLEHQPYKTLRTAFVALNMPYVQMNTSGDPTTVNPYLTLEDMIISVGGEPVPINSLATFSQAGCKLGATARVNPGEKAPDVCRWIILCPRLMDVPGYAAQVVEAAFVSTGRDEYAATSETFTLDTYGQIIWGNRVQFFVYQYSLRYAPVGNDIRYGQPSAGTIGNESVLQAESYLKQMYSARKYSRSSLVDVTVN